MILGAWTVAFLFLFELKYGNVCLDKTALLSGQFEFGYLKASWSSRISYVRMSADEQVKFHEIFAAHQEWEGHYQYNKSVYYSMLLIHSYNNHSQGVIATFKDVLGATIDVKGEKLSENDLVVTFSAETIFEDVNRFPKHFSFVGTLSQESEHWIYKGSVTVPSNGMFGEIQFQPTDGNVGPFFDDDDMAWRYALIIGVPIVLGLIGVAVISGMLYWAIKKGYIRHVPKNYDSFDSPVQYDNNKQTVHI